MPSDAVPLNCSSSSTSAATALFALRLKLIGLPSVTLVVSGDNVSKGLAASPVAPWIVMTAVEIFPTL